MGNSDFDIKAYRQSLNDWHMEISMIHQGLNRVLWESGSPQASAEASAEISAIGYVLINRFKSLVETCPFPPASD